MFWYQKSVMDNIRASSNLGLGSFFPEKSRAARAARAKIGKIRAARSSTKKAARHITSNLSFIGLQWSTLYLCSIYTTVLQYIRILHKRFAYTSIYMLRVYSHISYARALMYKHSRSRRLHIIMHIRWQYMLFVPVIKIVFGEKRLLLQGTFSEMRTCNKGLRASISLCV